MKKEEKEVIFNRIEFLIGYELPKELKKIYTEDIEINKEVPLMNLQGIYNEVENSYDEEIEEDLYNAEPENSILKRAYDKKRVPFIQDYSGNYIGIDFNPGENGTVGQIINYGCDEFDMVVFANCFADFIEGIKKIEVLNNEYITDYLKENNLNFRKDVPLSELPKKLKTNELEKEEISKEEANETIIEKELNMQNIKEIVDILQNMNEQLLNDLNIKKYRNDNFDYRIINKREVLSRTMGSEEAFYDKLNSYNKEEIKGYSFAITNSMEELKDDKIMAGKERIFVEINVISNRVLVRYTQTIKNKIMNDTYEKIVKYIQTL